MKFQFSVAHTEVMRARDTMATTIVSPQASAARRPSLDGVRRLASTITTNVVKALPILALPARNQ